MPSTMNGIFSSHTARVAALVHSRQRPLEGAYPYLWLDARCERVRDTASGMVRQKALLVAYGVHDSGRREVVGLQVGEVESEAEWRGFLRSLVARGLTGVRLAISDAHQGLRNAIGQVFAIFVIAVAAAEAAVGLGIILAFYRNKETVNIDEMNVMRW